METVIITGGTGMIGTALRKMLAARNYRVIVFSRSARAADEYASYVKWDPANMEIDAVAISQADHIIHLAGAGVGEQRWTKRRKKIIAESRIKSGELLVKALAEIPNKVRTVVSASGIGWYGPDRVKGKRFVESDPAYDDFLGKTCVQWEASIQPVKEVGKRLVILRMGVVLSNSGGALPEFLKPLQAGVATILGSGRQVISWIHIDDICHAYVAAIEQEQLNGVYNACAPETVTNKQFMLALAKSRRSFFIPVHVPAVAVKVAVGELSIEVLKSADVDSTRLRSSGFQFIFPTLEAALKELGRKSEE